MNQTTIVGNIGNVDPIRNVGNSSVLNFSVAVNDSYKDAAGNRVQKTTWFRCALWNGAATGIGPHLKKRMPVAITGEVSASAYIGKDGKPAASLELRVDKFSFINGAGNNAEESNNGNNHQPSAAPEFDDMPGSHLPF